jgi:hypothetical protein
MYKVKLMTGKKCFIVPFFNRSVGSGKFPWKWTVTLDWLFFDLGISKIDRIKN